MGIFSLFSKQKSIDVYDANKEKETLFYAFGLKIFLTEVS